MGHDEDTSEALAELFQFIGDATALDETLRRLAGRIPERAITELQYLSELYSQLEQLDASGKLRIDLSEVGNQPYHSGVAFQVYVDGIDSAVSAGGRYDGLLSAFGFDAPSVGFSLMLRKLQPIIERHGEAETPREPAEASGDSFAERYRHAQRERAKGNVVTL
jgi:ATP phosphoribosyltransferase regulatory subunit